VGGLGPFLRQGGIVEFQSALRVQAEVELIQPAEFKAGFADGVVAILRAGISLWPGRRRARRF
jgi:hypothetical protein